MVKLIVFIALFALVALTMGADEVVKKTSEGQDLKTASSFYGGYGLGFGYGHGGWGWGGWGWGYPVYAGWGGWGWGGPFYGGFYG